MADFKIQRVFYEIPADATTVTVTAGTDYDAPASLSRAWVYAASPRLSASASLAPDHSMARIENPGNLLTSLTLEREAADPTPTSGWLTIMEYVGAAGGPNEIIVRDQGIITEDDSEVVTTPAISGVQNDSDVCVLPTSRKGPQTDSRSISRNYQTSDWDSANQQGTFEGPSTSLVTQRFSWVVLELTGANWNVHRIEHVYQALDANEDETISPALGSTTRTIMWPLLETGSDTHFDSSGWASVGQDVQLVDTSTLRFRVSANTEGGAAIQTGVVWLWENTQTGTGEMVVHRFREEWLDPGNDNPLLLSVTPADWSQTLVALPELYSDDTSTNIQRQLHLIEVDEVNNNVEVYRNNFFTAAHWVLLDVVEMPTAQESATLEVTRHRWRNDDGTESTATFREAENTATTASIGETVRLRKQIQATGDPGETNAELRFRKKGTVDPWDPLA